MKVKQVDNIKKLLDKMSDIVERAKNKNRQKDWNRIFVEGTKQQIRVTQADNIPCTLFLGSTYWNKKIDLNIGKYYADAYYHLENYLKIAIERFENYEDSTFFEKTIPINLGVGFETELLGGNVIYLPDKDPWVGTDGNVVKEIDDIDELPDADFSTNKYMLFVSDFYEEMCSLVDDYNGFEVKFPDWFRGAFPLALELGGWEDFLINTIARKDLVHSLVRFITEFRISWCKEREKLTGEKTIIRLGNDEINYPTISPSLYEEFILPYELMLYNMGNKISYWHSCGNITPLVNSIAKIPSIDLIQVSPFTDLEKVIEVFSERSTAFQIWMHPVRDILFASMEHVENALSNIKMTCERYGVHNYCIVSGHIQPMMELNKQEEQISQWLNMFQKIFR